MSRLEELEEDLYGKDEGAFSGRAKKRVIFPRADAAQETGWTAGAGGPAKKKPISAGVRRLTLFIAGMGILFLAGGAVFVLLYLGRQAPEAEIRIQSRDFLEAGEEFTIPIVFANTSKTALRDVQLTVVLPEGSIARDDAGIERPAPPRIIKAVSDLAPGEEGIVQIGARIFGKEGDTVVAEAIVSYRPENIRARFSSSAKKEITVASVPLALAWDAPDTVSQKQDVTLRVRLHSTARAILDDMWLRTEYPPGFTFVSGTPKPDAENSFWKIGTLSPAQEALVEIRGVIAGSGGEIKTLRAGAGSYNEFTKIWKPWREAIKDIRVAAAPLSLEIMPREGREHVVVPGERLDIAVQYRNNSSIALKNISVSALIEGVLADHASIVAAHGGVFDSQRGALVWSPGGTPELRSVASGAGGELTFSVSMRGQPAVRTAADKNLTIKIHSQISAASIPEEFEGTALGTEDSVELKVESRVLFSGRAIFHASPIPTSGVLPPKVGQKTAYTIVWEVRNFTNDLENADIRILLPANVKWENAVYPTHAPIAYNAASGEVRWRLGRVPAGTGVLTPARIGAFQVSVVPAPSDAGRILMLAGESRLSAHDEFTGQDRLEKVAGLSTELRDDPLTTFKDWNVVK